MAKSGETKIKWSKNKKYMLVRYGRMNTQGWFEHKEHQIPKASRRVVIKTDRGLELGQLDISEERHLQKISKEEMNNCIRFAKELELPMKIVDAEHVFGGERVIFYFMSDGRVDFRQLVVKLAQEYQTRIEMRQIGSRDEAKLFADVETCGQECCCKKFLKALKPVNMRMAKMQKATLDPSKISGYCGRLKCCLRYEDKTYSELKKRLPRKNTNVKTKYGVGKVVDSHILTQLVVVEHAEGAKMAVPLEELEIIPASENTKQNEKNTLDKQDHNNNNNKKS